LDVLLPSFHLNPNPAGFDAAACLKASIFNMHFAASTLASLSLLVGASNGALTVDFSSKDSIKQAAKLVAADLMSFYKGDQPGMLPGMLPGPASTTGQRDLYFW
jgi:hypothetical protein